MLAVVQGNVWVEARATVPIRSLTGIRGAAAVWVMAFHFRLGHLSEPLHLGWMDQISFVARGWSGVDLFFVLSGFVLMYAHGVEFMRVTRQACIRFAKLRIGRLFPLNWVVLAFIVLVCAIDSAHQDMLFRWTVADRPIQAFFRTALLSSRWLPGGGDWNEPTWSLSAELVGYAAFPALAFWLLRLRGFWTPVAIAAGALGALAGFQFATGTAATNDMTISGSLTRMAACFIAGAAVCRARDAVPTWIAARAGTLSVAAAALALASSAIYRAAPASPAAFAALIFFLSFGRGPVDAIFRSAPLLFLGRISFPLYLIHMQIVLRLATDVNGQSPGLLAGPLTALGCLSLIIGVAWLLHQLVERPTHDLARRWAEASRPFNATEPVASQQAFGPG